MIAKRYTVRLYRRAVQESQTDVNLDPADDKRCREVLEDLVKAKAGDLNRDLSEWWIRVHTLGGGQVKATCKVTASGSTEVKR